jgi:outer membrane murein-binding lipoprotein Lpp
MKRSRVVRLTLSGTIAASLSIAGCSKSSSDDSADLSSSAAAIDAFHLGQ